MAVKIKNTLSRYLEKLQNYKGRIKEEEIKETAGEVGIETVKRNLNRETTYVDYELTNDGVMINAHGEDLPFIEFGTGLRGEGTYQGELPTQTLRFESMGTQQKTEGWEYNYWKKQHTFRPKPLGKWDDWIGQPAEAPIYNSARELEQGGLAEGIKNKIKES